MKLIEYKCTRCGNEKLGFDGHPPECNNTTFHDSKDSVRVIYMEKIDDERDTF